MCLLVLEVKEVVQEAEEDFGHPKFVMEDATAHPVAYEEQHIVVSNNQQSVGTSSSVISEDHHIYAS